MLPIETIMDYGIPIVTAILGVAGGFVTAYSSLNKRVNIGEVMIAELKSSMMRAHERLDGVPTREEIKVLEGEMKALTAHVLNMREDISRFADILQELALGGKH